MRVKVSAQQRIHEPDGCCGPDHLLGGLDASNYRPLTGNIVRDWTNDNIQLEFPADAFQSVIYRMADVAARRGETPPLSSDVEIGYQIIASDGSRSEWFYPQ